MILTVLLSMAALMSDGSAREPVMTMEWEKELVHSGDGEWDVTVMGSSFEDSPDLHGGVPSGIAVDNKGRIFICDSYKDRVLVFNSDGSRHSLLSLTGKLDFPQKITVDKHNNLYILGGAPEDDNAREIVAKATGSGWSIVPIDLDAYEVPPNAKRETHMRGIAPVGCTGLVAIPIQLEDRTKYQLFDEAGKPVGIFPTLNIDSERRSFQQLESESKIRVYKKGGEQVDCDTQVPDSPSWFIPFRSKLYILSGGTLFELGDKGATQDVVNVDLNGLPENIVASPCADYFYNYSVKHVGSQYSITFTKWNYPKAKK